MTTKAKRTSTLKGITDEAFVEAWTNSETKMEVAERLKIAVTKLAVTDINVRYNLLFHLGVHLKDLPQAHFPKRSKNDIAALNKVIEDQKTASAGDGE